LDGVTYAPGARFRVIGDGATLDGLEPMPGGYQSWRQPLRPGDVLTCTGYGPSYGGDPGYGVEFTSAESEAAGACHCKVRPMAGGMFDYHPAPGLIEPDDAAAGTASRRTPSEGRAPGMYDLTCSAEALRAAAAWAASLPRRPITLERYGSCLACRIGTGIERFPSGEPVSSKQEVTITPESLAAAAAWTVPGDDMAEVLLLVDDRMLLVSQGDDRTAFDTGGEPGSDEYLEAAPLDRP
jgi:hypothetical protein